MLQKNPDFLALTKRTTDGKKKKRATNINVAVFFRLKDLSYGLKLDLLWILKLIWAFSATTDGVKVNFSSFFWWIKDLASNSLFWRFFLLLLRYLADYCAPTHILTVIFLKQKFAIFQSEKDVDFSQAFSASFFVTSLLPSWLQILLRLVQ